MGKVISKDILKEAKIDVNTKSRDLTDQEVAAIREILETEYTVEGELRQEVQGNIRRLVEIGCYRGIRHRMGLPTRGQKTKSNARSRKGPRGTAIAKKKKAGK